MMIRTFLISDLRSHWSDLRFHISNLTYSNERLEDAAVGIAGQKSASKMLGPQLAAKFEI
jgi:hypothetical protein